MTTPRLVAVPLDSAAFEETLLLVPLDDTVRTFLEESAVLLRCTTPCTLQLDVAAAHTLRARAVRGPTPLTTGAEALAAWAQDVAALRDDTADDPDALNDRLARRPPFPLDGDVPDGTTLASALDARPLAREHTVTCRVDRTGTLTIGYTAAHFGAEGTVWSAPVAIDVLLAEAGPVARAAAPQAAAPDPVRPERAR